MTHKEDVGGENEMDSRGKFGGRQNATRPNFQGGGKIPVGGCPGREETNWGFGSRGKMKMS